MKKIGIISLAVACSVLISYSQLFQKTAHATAPTPGWWSGDCSVNNHLGSVPLGASFKGVKACGPINTLRLVNFGVGSSHYEWQCAELSMRYMYLVYGIAPYYLTGNAKTIVTDYSGTRLAKKSNNGSDTPSAGDILAFDQSSDNTAGHTAIVTATNVSSSGNGTITIMEQNSGWSTAGSRTLSVTNKIVQSGAGEGAVTGWLHNPSSSSTPGITRMVSGNLWWHLRNHNSSGSADASFSYGITGDTPIVGDWDGNGTSTIAINRTVSGALWWHLRNDNSSGAANASFSYGMAGDTPKSGDWDSNGSSTPATIRAASGALWWHQRNDNSSGPADNSFDYGLTADVPIVGGWDGSGGL